MISKVFFFFWICFATTFGLHCVNMYIYVDLSPEEEENFFPLTFSFLFAYLGHLGFHVKSSFSLSTAIFEPSKVNLILDNFTLQTPLQDFFFFFFDHVPCEFSFTYTCCVDFALQSTTKKIRNGALSQYLLLINHTY